MSSPTALAGKRPKTPLAREPASLRRCARASPARRVNTLRAASPDDRIVEDVRVVPGELPRLEERRPVDVRHEFVERIVARARVTPMLRGSAARRRSSRPWRVRARAPPSVSALAARSCRACCSRIFAYSARTSATYAARCSSESRLLATPTARDASGTCTVGPAVVRLDLHRGVRARRGRAADQERQREALRAPSRSRRAPSPRARA